MRRPYSSRYSPSGPTVRVNGKIRAREVRVIGEDGQQIGVLSLRDAINMAQGRGVDLVEVAPNAAPPVCRLVDYGKYRYEQSKREKEARKHQHANRMKEIQLSVRIDPHDYGIKLAHAIDFLCEDMKVKVSLRFRGREMMHTEFGVQVVERFVNDLVLYGHPDSPPKLTGRNLNLVMSPLPRKKRAKNPRAAEEGAQPAPTALPEGRLGALFSPLPSPSEPENDAGSGSRSPTAAAFSNSPFANLELPGTARSEGHSGS